MDEKQGKGKKNRQKKNQQGGGGQHQQGQSSGGFQDQPHQHQQKKEFHQSAKEGDFPALGQGQPKGGGQQPQQKGHQQKKWQEKREGGDEYPPMGSSQQMAPQPQQGGGQYQQQGGHQQKKWQEKREGGDEYPSMGSPQHMPQQPQQGGGQYQQQGGHQQKKWQEKRGGRDEYPTMGSPQQMPQQPQQIPQQPQGGGQYQQQGGYQQKKWQEKRGGGDEYPSMGSPQHMPQQPQQGGGQYQQQGGHQQKKWQEKRGGRNKQMPQQPQQMPQQPQQIPQQPQGGGQYQQQGGYQQKKWQEKRGGGDEYPSMASPKQMAQQPEQGGGQQQPQQKGPQQQSQEPSLGAQDYPSMGPPQQAVQEPQQGGGQKKPKGQGKKGGERGAGDGDPAPSRSPSQASTKSGHSSVDDQIKTIGALKLSNSPIHPGKSGRMIRVEANHLEIKLGKLESAIHYDVAIVPDLPKKMLPLVMERFREMHYPKNYPAFDGRKNLYAAKKLPFGDSVSGEVKVQDNQGEKTFKVDVKFANVVDLRPLRDMLSSKTSPYEALNLVGIVLRAAPMTMCIPVGNSFFPRNQSFIDLGEGMQMYNGFFQSAVRGWKPLLNVDVAHKAFPKGMPVMDALCDVCSDFRNKMSRADLERPLQRYQIEAFKKFIRMLRVEYLIPGQSASKRVYGVNDLDDPANVKTFSHDGKKMTIADYFKNFKRVTLKYPNLPTLWVGSRQRADRILLPMEFCSVLEGQALNRKMTENQTATMIKHSATNTKIRKDKIMHGLQTSNHNANPTVKEFGFSVGSQFEQLDARVLDPPLLTYGGNKTVMPSRGVWRADQFNFQQNGTVNEWTIIDTNPRPNRLDQLAEMLFRQSKGLIKSPATKPFPQVRQNDLANFFKKSTRFDLIVVVVPNSGPLYGIVKKEAELRVGLLTQCVKARTVDRINPQTIGNILLKVNSKLNGTNHILSNPPPLFREPFMIMGADVTHPSPDAKGIPSVVAVTASHDPYAFQYNICWRLQPPTVEIISDMTNITVEHLMYFYKRNNGQKPTKIIIFRDGVSEGQFEQVLVAEMRAIRSACGRLGDGSYKPSITFLVVQKRHHTRLFPMNPRDSEDKNMNVPAGTCVDTAITNPFMQNFFLVSHASIQGVAKPTKYCTLHDDNNLPNDYIEKLTYYLCHLFTRCNRSVSYPAPTYYAHLAAARAKVYIETENLDMMNLEREQTRFKIKDEIRLQKPMFFV